MTTSEVNRENRMRLPLKLRLGNDPGGAGETTKKDPNDTYNEVMETLNRNLQMEGAARASRAYSASADGGNSGRPETVERSAVKPFQDLSEAAQIFGLNFGELMTQKNDEAKALREATDAKDREIHELRLKEITQMEERIRNAAADRRGGGGDLGAAMGLGELDPEVRKSMQERALGLNTPPTREDREPRQPAPFTAEWIAQWDVLKPGMEALGRMMGMVPKDEAGSNQQTPTMVTMEEIKSGSVPIELALGLRKQEIEAKLEETRIEREDAREIKRIDVFGEMSRTVRDNAPDLISAVRDLAAEHGHAAELEGARGTNRGGVLRMKGIRCEECGHEFRVEQGLEQFTCPSCGENLEMNPGEPPQEEEPQPDRGQVIKGEHGEELSV